MSTEADMRSFFQRVAAETVSAIEDEARTRGLHLAPGVEEQFLHSLEVELLASSHRLDEDRKSLGIESVRSIGELRTLPTARGSGPHREFARLVVQNATYEGRSELTEGDLYRAFIEAGKRCALGFPFC
jgi:hypothetical protein